MDSILKCELQAVWSPEQIAGRLQIAPEGPGQITHETIYAFIFSPQGKALGLFRYLPMARRQRRTRYARKPRGFAIPAALASPLDPKSECQMYGPAVRRKMMLAD
ncbi:hypothetical protein AA309_17365 [Microvirga vignae]|uniref:Transposase n=1 Tax=Microvirga vignae TaxID=1225564 RepID=A0A0H1RAM6_9HYPH|nr:hypothetical protein [Microvirga vignae]KLK91876.1 hypothetical protein AA309_17365 [Microvirga vignae]